MDDVHAASHETFFTDKVLCDRWKCSHMKLWRLRAAGKLKSVKIGGSGTNLTPASQVRALEVAAQQLAPEAA